MTEVRRPRQRSQASELTRGANHTLGAVGVLRAVAVDVIWEGAGLECDLVAFAVDADGQVPDDLHFVFYNNYATPGNGVLLRQPDPAPGAGQRGQVFVDVAEPGPVTRVQVCLATVVEGATLAPVRGLGVRVLDLATGDELVRFVDPQQHADTSCLILGEVYRYRQDWKFRAVGQGHQDGLAGLATARGVVLG